MHSHYLHDVKMYALPLFNEIKKDLGVTKLSLTCRLRAVKFLFDFNCNSDTVTSVTKKS